MFPIDWKNPKKPEVSWHTTFTRKSSVLYLCFRLALERGCLRHLLYGQIAVGRHFSAAVGQADFVMWVTAQMQDFCEAKSDWTEKEAEVYTSPRPAAATH